MIINLILALSVIFSSIGLPNASLFLDKSLPTTSLQYSKVEDPKLISINPDEISSLAVKGTGIEPEISGSAAIAYDLECGEVLFGYRENEAFPIASLTKIMTAIVTLENIDDLNSSVTISRDAALIEGSKMGIWMEEKISVKDLLYGLILKSGNDAAKALQEYYDNEVRPNKETTKDEDIKASKGQPAAGEVAGEETENQPTAGQPVAETMVELMNEKAEFLGLKQTKFFDTTGIEDRNVSSPKDLAILTNYSLRNGQFAYMMKVERYTANAINGALTHPMTTTNRLLRTRDDVIAGKTGYSETAGWNHMTVFKSSSSDNHRIFTVALGTVSNDARFDENRKIIDWVHNSYRW